MTEQSDGRMVRCSPLMVLCKGRPSPVYLLLKNIFVSVSRYLLRYVCIKIGILMKG